MKHSKLYISAMLFAALAATSCDDNWDTPPMVAPVATIEANTSIEELKTKYWQEANNCVDTIGYKEDGKTRLKTLHTPAETSRATSTRIL